MYKRVLITNLWFSLKSGTGAGGKSHNCTVAEKPYTYNRELPRQDENAFVRALEELQVVAAFILYRKSRIKRNTPVIAAMCFGLTRRSYYACSFRVGWRCLYAAILHITKGEVSRSIHCKHWICSKWSCQLFMMDECRTVIKIFTAF